MAGATPASLNEDQHRRDGSSHLALCKWEKNESFAQLGPVCRSGEIRRIAEKSLWIQSRAKKSETLELSKWLPKLFAAGRHFVGLVRALDRASGAARIHVAQWRMWL